MKIPRILIYFLSAIIPYFLIKEFSKENSEKNAIKNPIEVRGGSLKYKGFWKWLNQLLVKDKAVRGGLFCFFATVVCSEFNQEIIDALSNLKISNSPFFIFNKLKQVKTVKISEEILEIIKSDAIQSLKALAINENLSFEDRVVFLRIKLESLLKFTFNSKTKKSQFIIALLIFLWFLIFNSTKAYAALLFAIRDIVKSTNLLTELKDCKFESPPFPVDELFDKALVQFEDKIIEDKIIEENILDNILIEVFKYSSNEIEDIVVK